MCFIDVPYNFASDFPGFHFLPLCVSCHLPAVIEIVTDYLSLPLGCFSPAVNKETELLGFLFYFFVKSKAGSCWVRPEE